MHPSEKVYCIARAMFGDAQVDETGGYATRRVLVKSWNGGIFNPLGNRGDCLAMLLWLESQDHAVHIDQKRIEVYCWNDEMAWKECAAFHDGPSFLVAAVDVAYSAITQ